MNYQKLICRIIVYSLLIKKMSNENKNRHDYLPTLITIIIAHHIRINLESGFYLITEPEVDISSREV